MAIGGVMTLLCGSCTLWWLGMAIWPLVTEAFHHRSLANADSYTDSWAQLIAVFALVIGGLPTALGLTLFFIGVRKYRRATPGVAAVDGDGGEG